MRVPIPSIRKKFKQLSLKVMRNRRPCSTEEDQVPVGPLGVEHDPLAVLKVDRRAGANEAIEKSCR